MDGFFQDPATIEVFDESNHKSTTVRVETEEKPVFSWRRVASCCPAPAEGGPPVWGNLGS
eukprot:1098763-Lingulodinium_polyedra.AAC.1